jgi:hypothetical protein
MRRLGPDGRNASRPQAAGTPPAFDAWVINLPGNADPVPSAVAPDGRVATFATGPGDGADGSGPETQGEAAEPFLRLDGLALMPPSQERSGPLISATRQGRDRQVAALTPGIFRPLLETVGPVAWAGAKLAATGLAVAWGTATVVSYTIIAIFILEIAYP